MIPMTVSFTKQNKTRAAVFVMLYGFSIIVIYVILGFLVTWILDWSIKRYLQMCGSILFSLCYWLFASSFFRSF
jgi:small neutral amino acid transporter SnatA (MarC family)